MLHLRKCHLYKGIAFQTKPFQHSLYVSFSIQQQTKQIPAKKQIELTDIPATPWPPVNPKLLDYEKQKGPQTQKQEPVNRHINVGGLFLFAGFICGAIVSIFEPKDFRNDFSFYSPLPNIYNTTSERKDQIPLTMKQTNKRNNDTQQDYANAMLYSLCLGGGAGVVGYQWYKVWTKQLRLNQSNVFELTESIKELRANWIRNWVKGTFAGSGCVLGIIYTTVFFSYLYFGQFCSNKYADPNFWDYMELQYKRSIEGLKKYELNVELQERINEKGKFAHPPMAPTFNEKISEDGEMDIKQDEHYSEINKRLEKEAKTKESRRKSYKNTYEALEWNTELYLNTKDISYYKLGEDAKNVRWNVAREMATLACSCTLYIVVPVFLGANFIAARVYSNYWRRIMQEMIQTKEMPLRTY